MIGYKLFRLRRDGTLGPLFINRSQRIALGVRYRAQAHRTAGYAFRPGWHICASVDGAPHLSKRGRVWCEVSFSDATRILRPPSQGGLWYLARYMTVLRVCHTADRLSD